MIRPLRTLTIAAAPTTLALLPSAQTIVTVGQNPMGGFDFNSIATAVATVPPRTIIQVVDSGVYTEPAIDFGGKTLALVCTATPFATIQPAPGVSTFLIDMSTGAGGPLDRGSLISRFVIRDAPQGAIDCSGSTPSIVDNVFVDNEAHFVENRGAAIFGVDASPLIADNEFFTNEAIADGGAVYIRGQEPGIENDVIPTEILGNLFDTNLAMDQPLSTIDQRGGAVCLDTDPDSTAPLPVTAVIEGNVFAHNQARGLGGAVSVNGRPVRIAGNQFDFNFMFLYSIEYGHMADVEPCLFYDSQLMEFVDSQLGGGAVALVDSASAELELNTYTGNQSDYHAGAVYVSRTEPIGVSDVEMDSETFMGNIATCRGGGVYVDRGSTSRVEDSSFAGGNDAWSDGSSGGEGGAVGFGEAGPSSIRTSSIVGNDARFAGAGVFAEATDLDLVDLLIDRNTPLDLQGQVQGEGPLRGGGVALEGGTAWIERCEIIRNGALGDGGGVYARDVSTDFTVLNCILGSNASMKNTIGQLPTTRGAAMYVSYGDPGVPAPFMSNTVARNRAEPTFDINGFRTAFGGVFFDVSSPIEVENCIAWNNGLIGVSGLRHAFAVPGSDTISVAYTDLDVLENNYPLFPVPYALANAQTALPRFVNPGQANFRIKLTSPCRNAGNDFAALISSADIDLDSRILGVIDQGADEHYQDDIPPIQKP